jgi:hypothetical protein
MGNKNVHNLEFKAMLFDQAKELLKTNIYDPDRDELEIKDSSWEELQQEHLTASIIN